METKKYIYAAVGAPVVVAKTAKTRVEGIRGKIEENLKSLSTDAQKRIEGWAIEGESTVERLSDSKSIDELTTRVDFDQMQSQVNKLRDQLEDLVATWRTNFRPATETSAKPVSTPASKPAASTKKPVAKKPVAKKPAAAAKKPAAKKPAASAKKPAAKKPAAKKAATAKAS